MADTITYNTRKHSASDLIDHMFGYLLDTKGLETELHEDTDNDLIVIQARTKAGKFKQFVGLDKAVILKFNVRKSERKVTVDVGQGKWVDKAALMATSLFVLWPLAVTSGIGIYGQSKLFKEIRQEMDSFMDA